MQQGPNNPQSQAALIDRCEDGMAENEEPISIRTLENTTADQASEHAIISRPLSAPNGPLPVSMSTISSHQK